MDGQSSQPSSAHKWFISWLKHYQTVEQQGIIKFSLFSFAIQNPKFMPDSFTSIKKQFLLYQSDSGTDLLVI